MTESACIDAVGSTDKSNFSYLRRHAIWIFLAWALWLSLEYFAFGPNSYVRLHNNADSYVPQLLALRQNISNGFFGKWQPQWGFGSDRAGYALSYNIAVPFFLIIPGWLGYAALMFTQRWIAGLFTFKLLREQCRVTELAAMWAALWYAMFCQTTLNRDWTGFTLYEGFGLPGIPLFLYLLGRVENHKWRDIALAGCAGIFWAIAAHVAYSFFIFPLAVFWFLFINPKRSKQFWLILAACLMLCILVAVPLNWPSTLLVHDSVRAKYRLSEVFGGPLNAVLGIANPFLDNLVPCCLIVAGVALAKIKNSRWMAVSAGIAMFTLAAAAYNVLAGLSGSAALQAFAGDRLRYCVPFLLGVGAAISIDLLNQKTITVNDVASSRGSWFYFGNGVAIFAVAVTMWQSIGVKTRTMRDMLDGQNQKNYFWNPAIENLQQRDSGKPPFRAATLAVGENVLPLFPPGALWAYGLETADSFLVLQSDRNRLFWEKVLWPSASRDQGLFTWIDSFGQQLDLFYPDADAPANFDDHFNINLLSLGNVRYIVSPIPLSSAHLRPIENAFLKQQLQTVKLNRLRRLLAMIKGKYEGMPVYLYENIDVLPRAFWVSEVVKLPSDGTVLDAISKAQFSELRSTAYLHARVAEGAASGHLDTSRAIEVTKYSADDIEVSFSKGGDAVLFISNSYSKFWTAHCGNATADVMPADHAFQGIAIPGDCEKLTLSYKRPAI